jgi:enterochelin esterase-like enzyme
MNASSPVPQPILVAAGEGRDQARRAIRTAGGSPLQAGRNTTFVFVGDVEEVGLHHWMDIFPHTPPMHRHEGTDLWSITIDVPERSRIEYKLSVLDKGHRRLILDPLNRRRARDPFGTNSVVTGPMYERPEWSLPRIDVPSGSFTDIPIESAAFGDRRTVRLYCPAMDGNTSLPLLVAHDGSEYVEFAALSVVLDNLIARGDIPPVACVLSDPGDRRREYTGDDRHADHIVEEVLPAIALAQPIDTGAIVAMGASLGGVASLHLADRHPGVFSGLVLHSGSFVTRLGGRFRRGPVFAPVVAFMEGFTPEPGDLPHLVHMSCGRFDGLVHDNRVLAARLSDLGVDVAYDEVEDGHNWENWRDRLRTGLRHVFGR